MSHKTKRFSLHVETPLILSPAMLYEVAMDNSPWLYIWCFLNTFCMILACLSLFFLRNIRLPWSNRRLSSSFNWKRKSLKDISQDEVLVHGNDFIFEPTPASRNTHCEFIATLIELFLRSKNNFKTMSKRFTEEWLLLSLLYLKT